jgi:hypothetical protein
MFATEGPRQRGAADGHVYRDFWFPRRDACVIRGPQRGLEMALILSKRHRRQWSVEDEALVGHFLGEVMVIGCGICAGLFLRSAVNGRATTRMAFWIREVFKHMGTLRETCPGTSFAYRDGKVMAILSRIFTLRALARCLCRHSLDLLLHSPLSPGQYITPREAYSPMRRPLFSPAPHLVRGGVATNVTRAKGKSGIWDNMSFFSRNHRTNAERIRATWVHARTEGRVV